MEALDKLLETIMKKSLTLLASRPLNGRSTITIELLYKYTIKQNKKTLLFSINDNKDFYIKHLITRISDIPLNLVSKYFNPAIGSNKLDTKINQDKFIGAIETIQRSDFTIYNNLMLDIDEVDYLLYTIKFEKIELLIIDNIDELIKKSKYNTDVIFNKLKGITNKYNTHILLLNNVSRDVDKWKNRKIKLKDINYYNISKEYVDNIILLKRYFIYKKFDIIEVINYTSLNSIQRFNLNYNREKDMVN